MDIINLQVIITNLPLLDTTTLLLLETIMVVITNTTMLVTMLFPPSLPLHRSLVLHLHLNLKSLVLLPRNLKVLGTILPCLLQQLLLKR
jgi:hypothetical protein